MLQTAWKKAARAPGGRDISAMGHLQLRVRVKEENFLVQFFITSPSNWVYYSTGRRENAFKNWVDFQGCREGGYPL
ncbi:hypothetical protein ATHL_02646 [Anaerolinea thermolimosa]|nr:hypothetical protein ATHL_02646 [Anaerolinea thermolimosa]